MQFIWTDLILRARTYVDDDHHDNEGYIAPGVWLTFANVEYAMQYRRWIRTSLVTPPAVDASFTGFTTTVSGVLATLGVARNFGDGTYRMLQPTQSAMGRAPFFNTNTPGEAYSWHAAGVGDNLTYTLEPRDPAGAYVVRYIATVPYVTDPTTTVELPYGADERLVIGMARRSLVKESATSRLLDQLMLEADAESSFTAYSRNLNDAPRVRRVARTQHSTVNGFPANPLLWSWR